MRVEYYIRDNAIFSEWHILLRQYQTNHTFLSVPRYKLVPDLRNFQIPDNNLYKLRPIRGLGKENPINNAIITVPEPDRSLPYVFYPSYELVHGPKESQWGRP